MLDLEHGVIRRARLALGGVAARPWRAREAEALLEGVRFSDSIVAKAAECALAEARPSGDNAFKIDLARGILARALHLAFEGTPAIMPSLPGSPFSSHPGAIHAA